MRPPIRGSQRGSLGTVLPTVTFATEGCVMGHWHNVVLAAWGVPASLAMLAELRRLMTGVAAKSRKMSMVNLTLRAMPLPAKDVRDEFVVMANQFEKTLGCAALFLEDTGFWSSAVRSLMTSINVLGLRPYKVTLSGSLDEIASWIAQRNLSESEQAIHAPDLRNVLQGLLDAPELQAYRQKKT